MKVVMKLGDSVVMVAIETRGDVRSPGKITLETDDQFFVEADTGGGKMWFDKLTLKTSPHRFLCTTRLEPADYVWSEATPDAVPQGTTTPSEGVAAGLTFAELKRQVEELKEQANKPWSNFFKANGFDLEAGDMCLLSQYGEHRFLPVPEWLRSQIVVTRLVASGTAAVFIKNFDPLAIELNR